MMIRIQNPLSEVINVRGVHASQTFYLSNTHSESSLNIQFVSNVGRLKP